MGVRGDCWRGTPLSFLGLPPRPLAQVNGSSQWGGAAGVPSAVVLSDELLVLSLAPRSRRSQNSRRKGPKLSQAQLDGEQPTLGVAESKDSLPRLAVLTYRHDTLYLDQSA